MSDHQPTHPRYPFPEPAHVEVAMAAVWEASTIPDRDAWVEVFSDLFPLREATHPSRAVRLAAYGWKPEDLRELCIHPGRMDTLSRRLDNPASEASREAVAALMHEVGLFHQQAYRMARAHRDVASTLLVSQHGWTPEETGRLMRLRPVKRGLRGLLGELFDSHREPMWESYPEDGDFDRDESAEHRHMVMEADIARGKRARWDHEDGGQ